MSPHKGPQIIRYCVITSTVALVVIAVSMIPQYKVNKGRILCADYAAKIGEYDEAQYSDLKNRQKVEGDFFAARERVSDFAKTNYVADYCNGL